MTRGTIWSRPCSAKGGVSMSGSCWSARPDPRRGGVLPVDAVEVEAAVAQVLDRAALAAGQAVGEAQIGDCDLLGIRGGVGGDAVSCDGEFRRGKDSACGIVDVSIFDVGQFA